MKLVRYGRPGKEKPGLIDAAGKLRDLSEVVADIDGATLAPRVLARLAKIKPESLPAARGWACPWPSDTASKLPISKPKTNGSSSPAAGDLAGAVSAAWP